MTIQGTEVSRTFRRRLLSTVIGMGIIKTNHKNQRDLRETPAPAMHDASIRY